MIHRKYLVIVVMMLGISWNVSAWEVTMSSNVLPPQVLGSITLSGTGATNDLTRIHLLQLMD